MNRFEVKSVFVSSGAIKDNEDIYKLMNIMIKVNYPSITSLTNNETREEVVDKIIKTIKETLLNVDNIDAGFLFKPNPSGEKIKNLTPFIKNEEIAKEENFGWYKIT